MVHQGAITIKERKEKGAPLPNYKELSLMRFLREQLVSHLLDQDHLRLSSQHILGEQSQS